MSPLEPLDPLLESPLSHPLIKQRAIASELLNEVIIIILSMEHFLIAFKQIQQGNKASGGMLLANMERHGIQLKPVITP